MAAAYVVLTRAGNRTDRAFKKAVLKEEFLPGKVLPSPVQAGFPEQGFARFP